MTDALVHRGPDDYGYGFASTRSIQLWKDGQPADMQCPGFAMGHRRLSILDLSEDGRQPFASRDRRYCMVYNGEVFNYLELRSELSTFGYQFATDTDTEVVLTAFIHWGHECFRRFNGMWACLIWDNQTRTLIASRDRFGIKPLYFCRTKHDWVFSSEIKPLFQYPGITPGTNKQAIFNFLNRNLPPVTGETYFSGIEELPPAHLLVLNGGQAKTIQYWSLPQTEQFRSISEREAIEEIRYLFTDAVRLRLRSDVKIGTMLSGGLDSTSVISTVRQILGSDEQARRAVGDDIQAFHASFPGLSIDEATNVKEICKYINLSTNIVRPLDTEDVEGLFDDANYYMEAPFHNSVPMVNTLLMRRAREAGVTVVLNGHGPDEQFGGYPYEYSFLGLADMVTRGQWLRGYQHFLGIHRNFGLSKIRIIKKVRELLSNKFMQNQATDPLFPEEVLEKYGRDHEEFSGRTRLERILKRDFASYILPQWLRLEDKISMAASIEARLPFLDYRLVELAFSLDTNLKICKGTPKYILRKAMQDRLPDRIVTDKRKFRFSGPEGVWLRGALKERFMDSFVTGTPLIAEFIDQANLQARIEEFQNCDGPQDLRLMWSLFSAEMWMRRFIAAS